MLRTWRMLGIAVATMAVIGACDAARAQDSSTRVQAGTVTYVSDEMVEVSGLRGSFTPSSTILSDSRTVNRASIHVGMPAQLEIDSAGRVLELDLTGVVE